MDSRRPPDFSDLIAGISRELRAQRLSFMLIGGQAVLLHGRPRLTEDIDITLAAGPARLADVLERWVQKFSNVPGLGICLPNSLTYGSSWMNRKTDHRCGSDFLSSPSAAVSKMT